MSCKVLVADDASFVRMMISQILIQEGLTDILEANNGFEAVELYKANMPVLTILDLIMPKFDGLFALTEIIAFDPGAKVIMCSAILKDYIVHEAFAKGVLEFVAKPFRPDELRKIIVKYIDPVQS